LREEIKTRTDALRHAWTSLRDKAEQRKKDLDDSLRCHQYLADANEAESWMKEKEPIAASPDYGKDEDSAEVLLLSNCSAMSGSK